MAGSIDHLLQRCYPGLELRDDRLVLSPQWPGLRTREGLRLYRHQLSLRSVAKRYIDRRKWRRQAR